MYRLCLLFFFARGGESVLSPSDSYGLRDVLHGPRQDGLPVRRLAPVQPDIGLCWQGALHAVSRGVALPAQPLNEGLGLLNRVEAHELPQQLEAALLSMNAATSLWSAVDGVAPVAFVEQAGEHVLVARDGVTLMQRQPRTLQTKFPTPRIKRLHGSSSFVR